ncbi:MAG: potassium transporter [Lysinibacillus sp.]
MNSISSSKNSAILLLIALIAAILFAVYYYVVTPKLDEVEAKEASISTLNDEITSIKGQITTIETKQQAAASNTLAMRKKVPQKRVIENVILNIEEIEAVTGTRIETIEFNNYDSLVLDSAITDPNAPVVEEGQPTDENAEEKPAEPPTSTIAKESLPPELKLVTFSIEVAALDFESLQDFLKEIENIERVMKIDTFDFSLPGEDDKYQKDADPTVTATIQVTTFFYEGEH